MVRTPRDYQEDAIGSFFDYFNKGNKGNPIISAATGSGKSLILAELVKRIIQMYPQQRIAMATHVSDLIASNAETFLGQYPNADLGIYSAGLKRKQPWCQIVYGGIQTMYKHADKLGHRDLLFIDECFSGDTSISTKEGCKVISEIAPGDVVLTATGYANVVAKSVKTTNEIYKVRFNNGQRIRVTGNHPILSTSGWTDVRQLEVGSEVFSVQGVRELWQTLQAVADKKVYASKKIVCKKSILLNILLEEAREQNKSYQHKGENESRIKQNRVRAISSWWRRLGDDNIEQTEINKTFVESIEIAKSTGDELVYNLQTDGHPSYFANGILAHNCHLLNPKDDGMYMSFINDLKKTNPYLKVIGLSATPWRQKGGSLIKQKNAIFTDIIYDISLGFLIKEGYLTPVVGKSSVIQGDLSSVKKIGGEFNLSQMEQALNKDELTKAALNEVEEVAKDRKKFLFFTSGIEHAENVVAELRSRGWECDIIIGSTSQTKRDEFYDKFKKSKQRYAIVNNTVCTTGTDLPPCDCIALLRGTQSSSLYIQILGRGCRTMYAEGFDLSKKQGRLDAIKYGSKPNCLLLDYAGNVERFGALDLIQPPFSYDKKDNSGDEPIAPPQKICPNCREPLHVTIRQCHCGYEFEFSDNVKHEPCATNLAVMSTEIKPVEHSISAVQYVSHVSKKGNTCLRIQYYDALGHITSEYLMFGSFGEPRRAAVEWFYNAVDKEHHGKLPTNTEEALAIKHLYKQPKKIVTKKTGRHLEVIEKIF